MTDMSRYNNLDVVKKKTQRLAQPAIEAPTKPQAPVKEPGSPTREPVTPVTPDNPFNPSKPAVLPKPKALSKSAAYEDEAEPRIQEFWNKIPENHPYSSHPIISKHGKELSQKSFDFASERAGGDMSNFANLYKQIVEKESEHKEELEAMAKSIVSQIFGIDQNMLNANLGQPEGKSQQPREINKAEINPELLKQIHKRITSNALIHGSATHIMMTAHHMIDEAIRRISPELLDLYNKISGGVIKAYWLIFFGDMADSGININQTGEEEVEFKEDGMPEVKATGTIFPSLVHELIKGTMELLSMHGLDKLSEEELQTIYDQADSFKDEQWLIQIGGELWRKFIKALPKNISIANVIAEFNKQSPEIVHDIIEKVISNPTEATQAFQEILGGSIESEASLNKQALTGDVIHTTNRKIDGKPAAKVLYNPQQGKYNVFAIEEFLKEGSDVYETYKAYIFKGSFDNEQSAIDEADTLALNTKVQEEVKPKTSSIFERIAVSKEENQVGHKIELEHKPTYDKIKEDVEEDGELDMTLDDMADDIRDTHIDEFDNYYDDEIGLPQMERELEKMQSLSDRDIVYSKKKPENAPSAKAPKKWFNDKIKEVKKGNPDYDEETVTKTVGRIWSDLSDSKKKEIREIEGKTYRPAKKAELDVEAVTETTGRELADAGNKIIKLYNEQGKKAKDEIFNNLYPKFASIINDIKASKNESAYHKLLSSAVVIRVYEIMRLLK